MSKTNAARILDKMGIEYELREYPVDLNDLSATKIAHDIRIPPKQVFKTLVARGDRTDVLLAVLSADAVLDLKAIAWLSGNRKVELVPLKEVHPLTGYVRGGVTALACKRKYPVYVDEGIVEHGLIAVSAGARGRQLVLAPRDYMRSVQATIGRIARVAGQGVSDALLKCR